MAYHAYQLYHVYDSVLSSCSEHYTCSSAYMQLADCHHFGLMNAPFSSLGLKSDKKNVMIA